MRPLRRFESALVKAESFLLVAILSVMVVMSFSQVIMRQFFGTGLLWGDTFLRHLVLWVGFLGAALATAEGKQFSWDIGVNLLKPRPKAAANILAHLATAAISILLTQAAWEFCKEFGKDKLFDIGNTEVPTLVFSIILPIGFGLVCLHTLIKAAYAVAELRDPRSAPKKKEEGAA